MKTRALSPLLLLLAACTASREVSRADVVRALYQEQGAARLVPMLQELIRFPTVRGNAAAHAAQQQWLLRTAAELGLTAREAGKVTEIELPGPQGAPVLGLVVHGDVQPVEGQAWSRAPFAGEVQDGVVYGRGAADDKGPLAQALLALGALRQSGIARTHTVRLLVGSDEESDNEDIKLYLAGHAPPDYSLVLDAAFPAIVGEKAWNALAVTAQAGERGPAREWSVAALDAGVGGSIVPDAARIELRWKSGQPRWEPLRARLAAKAMPPGTSLAMEEKGELLAIAAKGKAAHSGMNIDAGRNALVALALALQGELPAGQADDLLSFARTAGADLHGAALGLPPPDALWGGFSVNVATIKPPEAFFGGTRAPGALQLLINVRRAPALSGAELRARLEEQVAAFCRRTGAQFEASGFYSDEPLVLDPRGKLAQRLLAAYARATGRSEPAGTIGGGSYAKRLPNAMAFGMWFTELPYPGHDADEQVPVEHLQRGARVLIEALVDLATGPRIVEPLKP
jgi:succinyl-diaminopimelate desuccinylase